MTTKWMIATLLLGISAAAFAKPRGGHLGDEPLITPVAGDLTCLDAATGDGKFSLHFDSQTLGKPLAVGDTLYVATAHTFYALDAETGKSRWQFPSTDLIGGFTADAKHLFVGSGATLVALNPADGHTLWKYQSDLLVADPIQLDKAIIFNSLDGPVAVEQADGKLRWRVDVQWGYFVFSPLTDHRLCIWKPDEIYLVETERGTTLWHSSVDQQSVAPGALPSPAVARGDVICQLTGSPRDAENWSLQAREVGSGNPLWKTPLGQHDATGARTTLSDSAALCTLESQLSAINLADGKLLWQATIKPMEAGGPGPTLSGGAVFVPALSADLQVLDEKTGKVLWTQSAPQIPEGEQQRIAGVSVNGKLVYVTRNAQIRG